MYIEELVVEHHVAQPLPDTLDDLITRIADQALRIAAFTNLVQGH